MTRYQITPEQVIEEMRQLAYERPDFVYSQQPGATGMCSYVGSAIVDDLSRAQGEGCIVGQALARLGVSREDLFEADNLDDAGADYVLMHFGIVHGLDDETALDIRAVQSRQDAGWSWRKAYDTTFG